MQFLWNMWEQDLFFDEMTTSPASNSSRQMWQEFEDPLASVSTEKNECIESVPLLLVLELFRLRPFFVTIWHESIGVMRGLWGREDGD